MTAEKKTAPAKDAADKPVKKHVAKKPAVAKAAPKKKVAHKAPVADKVEEPTAAVSAPEISKEEAPKLFTISPITKPIYAVGKRKTSRAQILMSSGDGTIMINKLKFEAYFQTFELQRIVTMPFAIIGAEKAYDVRAKVSGGGIHSQAEALRHAIARAMIAHNPEFRPQLKKQGFLTRDPRVKERKKPGLKRARRAPQFSKR